MTKLTVKEDTVLTQEQLDRLYEIKQIFVKLAPIIAILNSVNRVKRDIIYG